MRKRYKLLMAIGSLAILAVALQIYFTTDSSEQTYATSRAETGTVDVTVSATGTVQPVTTVQVGSQASGTIAWIGVDFNSPVKKGQVLARLEPSTVETQIQNANANVANAQAARSASESEIQAQAANVAASRANLETARIQMETSRSNAERYATLSNVVAAKEIETARADAATAVARYEQARAQVAQAEAALASSKARLGQSDASLAQASAQRQQASVDLSHTVITSPIDGIVVSRDVDVGQTVSASLQAPTLFTLANDLSKMQILAAIDEADVGSIRQGLEVQATADAYPTETFKGRIAQVRLNAQAQENVVTYTAVVDVDNPEQKLRPGMTVNMTISVERREDVLTVPNAALRFRPELTDAERQELFGNREAGARREGSGARGRSNDGESEGRSRRDGAGTRQTVWVQTPEGRLEPRRIETGLTDGRVTEVAGGDLKEGDVVVTSSLTADSDSDSGGSRQGRSQFGGRGFGGSGRGPR